MPWWVAVWCLDHSHMLLIEKPPTSKGFGDFLKGSSSAWLQASLAGLNEKLGKEEALPMNRFRPNLVVTGTGAPFEEDAWEAFVIEGASHEPCKFLATIPCDRCKVACSLYVNANTQRMPRCSHAPQHQWLHPQQWLPCWAGPCNCAWLMLTQHAAGDDHQPGDAGGPARAAADAEHLPHAGAAVHVPPRQVPQRRGLLRLAVPCGGPRHCLRGRPCAPRAARRAGDLIRHACPLHVGHTNRLNHAACYSVAPSSCHDD